ncbi:MAG: site-specific integrase [Pseudodesulfovibrio sp.]|nr:site-specific integrase [Pseudodesulfovibrio sp.]
MSLQTGYLAEARPKARILASGMKRILTQMRNGDIPMDDFDRIKFFLRDFLERFLKEHEQIAIHGLTPPTQTFQYVPGETEQLIEHLKGLLLSRDYNTMREYAIMATEDGAFGPPQAFDLTDEFAHEFTKTLLSYYRIISHRAEGDYNYENSVMPPQATYTAPPEPKKKLVTLKEALKQYKADKIAKKDWKSKSSANDIMSTLKCLTDILGEDIPVDTIDRQSLRHMRDTLLQLPTHRNKVIFRDKTIAELVALEPDKTISVRTVNNNLTNCSTFFTWCEDEGLIDRNPCRRLKIKEDKDDIDHRSPFTIQDLHNIFHAPEYVQDSFKHPSDFWGPILGLYTGARREELCQLHIEDVRQEDGLWVLDINDNPNINGFDRKGVKRKHTKRLVPLHPFLVDVLRFPQFARQQEAKGHLRVFPELVRINEKYGHKFGERFGHFKKTIELEEAEGVKVFHSFRHTFSNFFKQREMQTDIFTQTFGHKLKKLAASTYGGRFPASLCFEKIISHLDYEVDLSHLANSKYVSK